MQLSKRIRDTHGGPAWWLMQLTVDAQPRPAGDSLPPGTANPGALGRADKAINISSVRVSRRSLSVGEEERNADNLLNQTLRADPVSQSC